MPFYEYRPKSGDCNICGGRFVDLQAMSEASHTNCPECRKPCERILSAPIVSTRGSEYRNLANSEKRRESFARARGENISIREAAIKKAREVFPQLQGHSHDCIAAGCYGEEKRREVLGESNDTGKGNRIGGFPHLVGTSKK